jgi:hypothetical protein
MNAEFDRDLTSEEQEQLSGGLFFREDFPGEFADQFQYDSAPLSSRVASGAINLPYRTGSTFASC